MKADIKKSWFRVHYKNPKRIKRYYKKFIRKETDLRFLNMRLNSHNLTINNYDVVRNNYYKQIVNLRNLLSLSENKVLNDSNIDLALDLIYEGKPYWSVERELKKKLIKLRFTHFIKKYLFR